MGVLVSFGFLAMGYPKPAPPIRSFGLRAFLASNPPQFHLPYTGALWVLIKVVLGLVTARKFQI